MSRTFILRARQCGKTDWYANAVPCKLGTMPAVVHVHGGDKIEVGRWVRIKEQPGDRWHKVKVTRLGPGDHFFADR